MSDSKLVADETVRRRPTPPGEVLRDEVLDANGITQDQLAEAMGVSRLTINQLVNGHRTLTAETALKLAKATRTTAAFWLRMQMAVDLYDANVEVGGFVKSIRPLVPTDAGFDDIG